MRSFWRIAFSLAALVGSYSASLAQSVTPAPAVAALVCAFNTSPPTISSGGFVYVQCDDEGKLIASSSSGVTSVSNSDGTLTISPTTGDVVASLNLNNPNTWTGIQTFTTPVLGAATGTSITLSGIAKATTLTLTTAAPTVSSGQVSYGSTTAAVSNCGITGPTACLVINVAGTAHYIPYY